MTDVIRIAKERRARLVAEIAKLDSFVRMADVLVKYDQGINQRPAIDADQTAAMVLLDDRDGNADFVHQCENSPDAMTVSTIEEAATVRSVATIDAGTRKIPAQLDAALNKSGVQSVTALRASSDHFAFNEKATVDEEVLVLDNPLAGSTASVDVHVGQRMRQRRWMMGMTQQQLGDIVGVKFEQIQKYEAGTIHIGAGRMWDVAAAMEVPMSYFFEGIEGQAADMGEARSDILTDHEAAVLNHGVPQARKVQAS